MTIRQTLILYLISLDQSVRGIYTLVNIFERAQFPANLTEDLNALLKNNMLRIEKNFDNGTPSDYGITHDGIQFLKKNFNALEIEEYIKTMDKPDLLLTIIQKNKERKNGL